MSRRAARALWGALVPLAASCAYFNALWTAEHLAGEARKLEARGREPEARGYWARAAAKAESVVARHPRSRWADDALLLRGEGLARSGNCRAAVQPLAEVRETSDDAALRERADLLLAECALGAGNAVEATRSLAGVLESRDARRRSRAALLTGRAAQQRGDLPAAVEWYRRSAEPAAGPARARALLVAGRLGEAVALMDTLASGRFSEGEWATLLRDLASIGGPAEASRVLDRLLERRRLPVGARARLLLEDGNRLFARGLIETAAARYAAVIRIAPDSGEGAVARVRQARTVAARADRVEDLLPLQAGLARLARPGGTGAPVGGTGVAATAEAQALAAVIERVTAPGGGEASGFRAAELARDSLGAVRLAGRLFLRFAEEQPGSLFAPKALVAAMALLPERRDSLAARLESDYGSSPYTLALRGEQSPAFAVLEDSLAQALGVEVRSVATPAGSRVAPPVPGPRGPALEVVLEVPPAPGAGPAPAPAPGGRPRDADDHRRRPADRQRERL